MRFVFNAALTYGVTVVGMTDVYERFYHSAQHPISLVKVMYYILVGIPIGLVGWSSMEGKYQKALHESRVTASPGAALPPHSNP